MRSRTRSAASKGQWAGRVISAVPILFLLFDSVMKLAAIQPVAESFARLGYPVDVALGIGILEMVCIVFYVIPRTSVFGAILLTGYLGGAVATHVRVGDPIPTHILFPIYVGALIWVGLFLREGRLRALVPSRTRVEA